MVEVARVSGEHIRLCSCRSCQRLKGTTMSDGFTFDLLVTMVLLGMHVETWDVIVVASVFMPRFVMACLVIYICKRNCQYIQISIIVQQ